MQTDTEFIRLAVAWESVRLPNGAYRIQNVTALTEIPDLTGFRNCTECGIFVDQLDCVRTAIQIDSQGLWIGLVKMGEKYNRVTTLLWDLQLP